MIFTRSQLREWFPFAPSDAELEFIAASKPTENGFELSDDVFERISAKYGGRRTTHFFSIDAGLDAEIKRATGQTPCRGCGG